jgi:chromosome segregation ATPase
LESAVKGYDSVSLFANPFTVGWFTITPMLQDLDSLAARISQMVTLTRQLQDERSTMQARVRTLEQERDALRDQLERREADYSSVSDRIAAHETELQSVHAQARATQATLETDVDRYKAECETVKHRLAATQSDASHLRLVADKAKNQIDSILMRLPGAPRE